MFIRTLTLSTLALAGLSLSAGDFKPLMKVARATWPEKTTIGVICNYAVSAPEIRELAEAAGPETLIRVVDIQRRDQVFKAAGCLLDHNLDYLVLLTRDSVVPDFSIEATQAVRFLASHGVPTISTSSVGLRQGVVFAVGDRTHGTLMVCQRPLGTINVALPDTQKYLASFAVPEGMASVQVANLR